MRKLQPGEAMVVRQGRIERRWTWYRLPGFSLEALESGERDWVADTASHLQRAVHRQMVADVPVGAFLSGGLDSSAVVTFARELNPEIRYFTIEMEGGQEDGAVDDLPYARRVAEYLGVSLDVVTIDAGWMAHELEGMVAQMDEPLADLAPLNVFYISQLARQHGMKVWLSGAGGDDLFTGYRRHRALLLEKWWRWLPGEMRTGLDKAASRLDQRRAWARRLAKLFNGGGLDGDASIVNYFLGEHEADLLALESTRTVRRRP
ncbi:MAG: asparagine synthase [Chromatiaceae bacterium]|nr:asparagine synthase [Chromatiaceae bacterium]